MYVYVKNRMCVYVFLYIFQRNAWSDLNLSTHTTYNLESDIMTVRHSTMFDFSIESIVCRVAEMNSDIPDAFSAM